MSYAAWYRQKFHRPLHVRAWASICAKASSIRFEWRRRRRSMQMGAIRDCGECPMNGSSFCPCINKQEPQGTP